MVPKKKCWRNFDIKTSTEERCEQVLEYNTQKCSVSGVKKCYFFGKFCQRTKLMICTTFASKNDPSSQYKKPYSVLEYKHCFK